MALRFYGNMNHPVRKSIVCLHNDKRRYNLVSWTMDDEFFVVVFALDNVVVVGLM